MTIDEAKNKIYKYISFSQENIDLLVALKVLIQDYENGYKEAYNKAIDDFVNACKDNILCQTFGLHQNGIEKVAEQLKADEVE